MISRFLLLKEMMAAKLRVELMDTVRAAWILGIMIIRLGVMLLFITQIFRHTNTLMGYTKVEVILVFLIFQWMSTFLKSFFPNRKWMENWMKNGGVNEILGRPVHPLVSVIFSQINILGLLYFFFISLVLAIYTLCHPGLFKGIFLVSLLAGSSLAFSLQWFMYSVIVVTRKWAGAIDGFYSVLSLMIFPMDIYPFFIRALLIYVIPVAPLVYFPAQALFGAHSSLWMLMTGGMIFLLWGFSLFLWRKEHRGRLIHTGTERSTHPGTERSEPTG